MSTAAAALEKLMARYRVEHLATGTPGAFEAGLRELMARDEAGEYDDPGVQRDQAVRFAWGHDHDFGTFSLAGAMGRRHIDLLAALVDSRVLPFDLGGRRVLDIGPWTGGTSLLLAAMGAQVTALEEVAMYADCLRYLAVAFGVDGKINARCGSIYELPGGAYDYVLMLGVLYHLSDPVAGLRAAYEALRSGGALLLETAINGERARSLTYEGPTVFTRGGSVARRSRRGWNWMIPSAYTAIQMLADVGFAASETVANSGDRLTLRAVRLGTRDMMRAGTTLGVLR